MQDQDTEQLINKPTKYNCRSKRWRFGSLIATIILWIQFPFNLIMMDYFKDRNERLSGFFLALLMLSFPFYIITPIVALGTWGWLGPNINDLSTHRSSANTERYFET